MQSFTATAEEEVETEDYSSFRVKTEKQAQRKKKNLSKHPGKKKKAHARS